MNKHELDGKIIQITWPDKTVTTHTVKISEILSHFSDMGHRHQIKELVPMITINIHGHHMIIQLEKLKTSRKVKIEVLPDETP